jgi:CubicO group peptidase (beta-lactamase class C family)
MLKARRPTTAGLFFLCLILSVSIRSSAAQTESLDSYLNRTFTSIPGATVSVISGGKIVFENGYGYADSPIFWNRKYSSPSE